MSTVAIWETGTFAGLAMITAGAFMGPYGSGYRRRYRRITGRAHVGIVPGPGLRPVGRF